MSNLANDDYTLDLEVAGADLAQANKAGGGQSDKRLFRPKPFKDGQTYQNKLFIGLVRPNLIPGLENYPLDHKLFYIKLYGHYVAISDDGKKQEFVLCKRNMNKHAQTLAKNKGVFMFEDDRCPQCEEADVLWDQWNARWAELGYPDQESKKSLSKEQYKSIAADAQLTALKDSAVAQTVKDRYAFPIYDMEQQPLSKGFQWYFGPETVFKGIMALATTGVKFYSLNPHPYTPDAVEGAELIITKDTTKGARFCTYDVKDNRAPLTLHEDELNYLKDQANLPPLMDLVSVWDYDTHKQYVTAGVVTDETGAPAAAAPAAAPARQRPAVAPAAARPPVVAPAARPAAAPAVRTAPAATRPAPAAAAPAARPAPAPAARPGAPVRTMAPAPAVEQPAEEAPGEEAPAETEAAPAAPAPAPAARTVPTTPATTTPAGAAPKPRRTW